MSQISPTLNDAALGCLLGALVGDAAGATLEFLDYDLSATDVDRAMTMPGGGDLQVARGQITDDGELTLCLAQALSSSVTFSLETVAKSYAKWVESCPFDMGFTTSCSLGCYSQRKWQAIFQQQGYAGVMSRAASELCLGSKANGSLMRITPLGIWGYSLADEELADCAMQDSRLSHPNLSCCYGVACYVIAIASLLRQPGDRETAFLRAKSWLESQKTKVQSSQEQDSHQEVTGWLQDAENNINIPYYPHIGFIKIAFTHAFRHLLLGSDYVSAIRETLTGGGDTDTNACIVGGLVGAAVGAEAIPEAMRNAVLCGDTEKGKHPRPSFLHPQQVPSLVEKLLDCACVR